MDSFKLDYDKATSECQSVVSLLQQRKALKAKGETTGRLDYQIKGMGESIKQQMRNLDKQAYLYKSRHDTATFSSVKNTKPLSQ